MPEKYREYKPIEKHKPPVVAESFSELQEISQENLPEEKIDFNKHDLIWDDESVDVEGDLSKVGATIIEIGGPTIKGFELLHASKLQNPVYISNIKNGLPVYKHSLFGGYKEKIIRKVDFVASGSQMPIKDESVDAVLAACLPSERGIGEQGLRFQVVQEAINALKIGGYLILNGARYEDIEYAISLGFVPVRAIIHPYELPNRLEKSLGFSYRTETWSIIFKK